jgi:hypothetical protein
MRVGEMQNRGATLAVRLRSCEQALRCAAAAVAVACMLGVVACGSPQAGIVRVGAYPTTEEPSREQVMLAPVLGAGEGGWCVTTTRGAAACPSAGAAVFRGPIVVEMWGGHGGAFGSEGSSVSLAGVREGIVLTTSDVAAVSFEGGAPIPTHPGPALPKGLRGAVLDLRDSSQGTVPPRLPRARFVALNSKGKAIAESSAHGPPLQFRVPSRRWGRSEHPQIGVCTVEARKIAGLVSEGGAVMTAIRPHVDVRGREFVDCLQSNYMLERWPIEVDVLVDAMHPGSTPATLPALQSLAGHPAVYEGPGPESDTLARRIPGAWLLVAKGENLGQRLRVLEHLHVMIRG